MAAITIRNIDEQVKTRLRQRAAARGRSMEEEARRILSASVGVSSDEPKDTSDLVERIRARFAPLRGDELELPPRGPGREPPGLD